MADDEQDTFVVRAAPARVRRAMVRDGLTLLAFVLLLVLVEPARSWPGSPYLVLVLVMATIVREAWVWRTVLTNEVLMEVGPAGIGVARLGRGWVEIPWGDVATVTGGLRRDAVVKPKSRFLWERVPIRYSDRRIDAVLAAVRARRPAPVGA